MAGVSVLAIMLAACGSDDDSSTDSTTASTPSEATAADTTPVESTATTTADTTADTAADGSAPSTDEPVGTDAGSDDPLGTPTPAEGEPVKIGLLTESGGEAIGSQSSLTEQGAEIAVQYVNEYRGGLGGRPIELVICGSKATASGASDCANQMVEQDVDAVIYPFNGFGAQQVPIITGAGIPVVAVSGSSTEELTAPGVFVLTGGFPGSLGAYAQHSLDTGISNFAMVTIDVPAATQAAETLGGLVFANAGVEYSVIAAPPGTPDLTSQLQAAISGGADAIGVTGDVTFCTSFLQAYQTLNLDVPKYIIAPCIDPTVIESLGSTLDGSILATVTATDGPDAEVYGAMVEKYGDGSIDPDPAISAGVSSGVASVMNLWNMMDGFEGEVAADTIMEQAKTATDVELWMSGGLTFACDGTAISILPNVCSSSFQIGTVGADGLVTDLQPVDASALFAT
jgi:branched-chain amino acid transport system substrate-binding protein